jgi:FAD/FMN-containing dehydrogenase
MPIWPKEDNHERHRHLNFTGLADETPSAGVDTAFGRNLERLAKVKAAYDPDNLFRLNNNITPA